MKKAIIFIVIIALVLFLTPAMIYAKGGPAEKATGSIEAIMGNIHLYADFNAHEATDHQPAKGTYHVWGVVNGVPIDWYGDITDVSISGDTAILHGTFVSGVTEDGIPHTDFSLKITDGGSPGAGNDTFSSAWGITDNPAFNWTIVGGNLVVHTYEK